MVELQLYDPLDVRGLLQTPEYARALLRMRRPAYTEDEVERFIAARVARKSVFDRDAAPELSFVLFADGTAVERSPVVANGRPLSEPGQLRILKLRYGIIRAQALTLRKSTAFL